MIATTFGVTTISDTRKVDAATYSSITVRPDSGTSTTGSWGQSGCSAGNFYNCIDEDPDTPDDASTYVQGPNRSNTTMWVQLGAMPADFGSAVDVEIKARHQENGSGDDTITAYYQVFESNESTALTAETSAVLLTQGTYTTRAETVGLVGSNNTKTAWDGARLGLRQAYAQVSTQDTTSQARITAVELNMTYVSSKFSKLAQQRYIFENDDEDQVGGDAVDENTAQAAGNTALTDVKKGERLTLRTQIDNTGDGVANADLGLFYDRNDGLWTQVRNANTAVTGAGSCADTNFDCSFIDSASNVGNGSSIAIGETNSPWVAYHDDTGSGLTLRAAHYVGSGGTGCATAEWSCFNVQTSVFDSNYSMAVDLDGTPGIAYRTISGAMQYAVYVGGSSGTGCASSAWTCTSVQTVNLSGRWASLAYDASGTPWISYLDSSAGSLRVARYVGGSSGNCDSTAWSCTTVASSGNVLGSHTSIAFDAVQAPWVSYYDETAGDLSVARYVGSSGTGCTSSAWTCTAIETTNDVGQFTSIAFDPSGAAWISYYDVTGQNLRVAQYVASSGTGCASSAWTCTAVETTNSVGTDTSIAFDSAGKAWVTYFDDTNDDLRLARYVGSGGTGCATAAWSCTSVDTGGSTGSDSSIAFDDTGRAWISSYDTTNTALRVARLRRGGEILIGAGLAGSNGDALSESHTDMTSATNTANRDDADCSTGGATWNAGKWFEVEQGMSVNLPAGNVTTQCTEVAFVLDTSQATAGTTYRFVIASKDGMRADKNAWRGPVATAQTPTITIESSTTLRAVKDNSHTLLSCTDATWGCLAVQTNTASAGIDNSMAFAPDGGAWISYRNYALGDLWVARFVGSGNGSNCGTNTAWTCTAVETTNDVGSFSQLAIDQTGTPWIAYYDATNSDLRVARYVGSGGTGCASSAWTCVAVDTANSVGYYTSIAIAPDGKPWVSYQHLTSGDLRLARYVGVGGTGCATPAWTCISVDNTVDVSYTSITFDANGMPWISYQNVTALDLRVARYVGAGGTGCASADWSCTNVDSTNSVGTHTSITSDRNGTTWVSYRDETNTGLKVARYVGSSGSGCAVSSWSCAALETTNDVGKQSSITIDSQGNPWISYFDETATSLDLARYVGGSSGNCVSTAWTCSTIDNSNHVGEWTSLAFDRSGTPWIAYFDRTADGLRSAKLHSSPLPLSYTSGPPGLGRNATTTDGRYRLDFGKSPRTESGTCSATANNEGYCALSTDDTDYDGVVAASQETPTYTFAGRDTVNSLFPSFIWKGQSTVAASTRNVKIEVYRFGTTNAWVTLATNSAATANTQFTLTGTASAGSASEYWEADGSNYWTYYRVSQAYNNATMTLTTDYFKAVNSPPDPPTSLTQYKSNGSTVIAEAAWTNETSVVLKGTITDQDNPDTDQLCVEVKSTATSFDGIGEVCGTGVAYSGSGVLATAAPSGLTTGTAYHWRARSKDVGGMYSAWVTYGSNTETDADFSVDTSAPTGGTVYDGTSVGADSTFNTGSLSQLSANWSSIDASTSGLSKYEYAIGTTSGGTDVRSWTDNAQSASVTATGLVLRTNQTYYVAVRTTDNAGNTSTVVSNGQMVAPMLTFEVNKSVINFDTLNAGSSYTDTDTVTMTTSTNGYGGYEIRARASGLLTYGAQTIPWFNGGSYALPDSWQAADRGIGYTTDDTLVGGANKFQAATCPGGTARVAPGCYAPFSTTASGDVIADHASGITGSPITEQFVLTARTTVSATQPAGMYSTAIVLSATATF